MRAACAGEMKGITMTSEEERSVAVASEGDGTEAIERAEPPVTDEEALEPAQASAADEQGESQHESQVQLEEDDDVDWRARAELAERRLLDVAGKLGEVERSARELYAAMETQRLERIGDVLLLRAGVTDLQAARAALADRLAAEQQEDADDEVAMEEQVGVMEAAVRSLAVDRPGLFGGGHGPLQGVLRSTASGARSDVERAAEEARSTGDRRQLLRYLRLRRSQ